MVDELLTTRGNIFLNIALISSIILPFIQIASIYFAKAGKYDLHKRTQILMLSFFIALILMIVMDMHTIKKIVQQSSFNDTVQLYTIFTLYLISIITTIILWFWLIIKSYDRYPIHFRFDHKKWGKLIFFGVCLTSGLGVLLYWMISIF
jgi:hypothetical protein